MRSSVAIKTSENEAQVKKKLGFDLFDELLEENYSSVQFDPRVQFEERKIVEK
jgi:hypothetical protein